jgi:hypothetical protein
VIFPWHQLADAVGGMALDLSRQGVSGTPLTELHPAWMPAAGGKLPYPALSIKACTAGQSDHCARLQPFAPKLPHAPKGRSPARLAYRRNRLQKVKATIGFCPRHVSARAEAHLIESLGIPTLTPI